MSGSNVVFKTRLDAILRAAAHRILAERPAFAGFDMDAGCDAAVSTRQAALIIAVLREAILNSVDYAHPAGVPGRLFLSSARDRDKTIRIEIVDDGVGLPEGFDPAHDGGDGFRAMRRASTELGAGLSFQSSCLGLVVSLFLPAVTRDGDANHAPDVGGSSCPPR